MKIFPSGILKTSQTISPSGEESNVKGLPWKVVDDDGTIYEFEESDRESMEDLLWEVSQNGESFKVFHNGIQQEIKYQMSFSDMAPTQVPGTNPQQA